MRFACLSLAVLVLVSVVTADNVWESDANQYQEVMKNLENENLEAKKSIEKESKEQKKGNVEYLSTFFITNYQTWMKSGVTNVNGEQSSWTSTHIASTVTSHVSTFHGNEQNVPAFTSLYTSLYTQVYTSPTQYVYETQIGTHADTKASWSTKFNLGKCNCKAKFLSADKWLGAQLKTWSIAVRPLQQKSQGWFKKNKRIGKWWIREVKDDRYEQWNKWVTYLQKLRAKHISMGGKKFNKIFATRVNAQLKTLLKQLGKRLKGRIQEAKKYLSYKIVPHFTYKSTVFKQYRLLAANLWRRTEKAKFGSLYLRLYRNAQKWYKSQPRKVKCLWKTYKRVYLNLYKHYISLMKPWYKAMLKSKTDLAIKYLRKKWRTFIKTLYRKLKSFVKKTIRVISSKLKRVKGKIIPRGLRIFLKQWLRREGRRVRACKVRMLQKLRKYVKISTNVQLIKKALPRLIITLKQGKVTTLSKGSSKFSNKVCRCTRKFLFANDWLAQRLKYWEVAVSSMKKDIKDWFNKNKKVGRWWLLQAEDHVYQIAIEWTRFLYEMRKKCIRIGSAKFEQRFHQEVRNKLISLLTLLKGRLSALVTKGYKVIKSLKNPLLKKKLTKLLNYKPRFKKPFKLISARIWQLREAAKFKSLLVSLRKTAKVWSKKNKFNAKWWKLAHERLVNTAFKQYKKLEKVYLREIQRKGYDWYRKYGQSKWKATITQLKVKVKPLNKAFLKKSRVLLHSETRKVSPAVKAKFLKSVKAIRKGFILLSTKLQRKLKRVVTKGLYDYIKIVEKPVNKKDKKARWSLVKRPKLPIKFKIRTCNCDKRTLAANAWFAKQLRKWDSATEKWQRKLHFFYVANKKIGKWWLYESEDDVYELWIQWVWYLDNLRKMRVYLGASKFAKTFKLKTTKQLNSLVAKLKERVIAQLHDGKSAYTWKKHPAYKAKLALLQKYRPRFKKTYRIVSSNIWLREESGKFGAFVLRLYRSAKSIHKVSLYRRLINVIYKRYHQLLRIYARGLRRYGYIWHIRASNEFWRTVRRSFRVKVATIHKTLLTKAASLLATGATIQSASVRVSLRDSISLEIKYFNRFATKIQNKTRRLVARKWIRRITKDRWKVTTIKGKSKTKRGKQLTKLRANKKVKVSKQVKVGAAIRWVKKENAAFAKFIRQLHKLAKSWHKRQGKKLKGWLKIHTQLLRTAAKAHKSLTRMVSKLIKKHGYRWYLKHGKKKYQKSKLILRKKTKLIHKIVIAKSKTLLAKKHRINLAAAKSKLSTQLKKLLQGFLRLSKKLKRTLKPLFKVQISVSVKSKKSSSGTVKFRVRTCNCQKKFISANKWLTGQIKKFSKLTKTYKKRLLTWYRKHKKIGKWWLLKGLDAIDEVWIEFVSFLEELRESAIALGPTRFHTLYEPLLQAKLSRSLSKIQRRIVAHIKKGRKVVRQLKKSTFKSKLARLRQCRRKFQMTRKILLANVWRRNVRADFRAYLLRLLRITRKWYKNQPRKVKWALKLYRPVMNKVYTNFLRVLNTMHKTIKRHGFKWYKKYGREKFTNFLQKTYNTARRITRVVMQKSSRCLTIDTGVSLKALKNKVKNQLVSLMKQTEREGRIAARKLEKFIKKTTQLLKRHRKKQQKKKLTVKVQAKRRGYLLLSSYAKRQKKLLRLAQKKGKTTHRTRDFELKMKVRPVKKIQQRKCRVTDADLLGGMKSLVKARKCLLRNLTRKEKAKRILKLHVPKPTLAANIWQECQTLKFKALLKRLIVSAKKWHIKQGKKLKGFLKTYKQIIRAALKAHKSLTKMLSKAIKKHGYRWFLKHGQKAHKKALKVLRSKVQLIHNFVMGNAKVIVKKRHRVRLNEAKKRLSNKIKKLLRGFILLSTKLKRRVRAAVFTIKRQTQIVRKKKKVQTAVLKKKRHLHILRKPKIKVRPVKKIQQRKCRVTDADLLGGMKSLVKARKCLLRNLSRKERAKQIIKLHVPKPTLAANIWQECQTLKFKALLKRLIVSAKKWHIKQGKKLKGFLKSYKQIIRAARIAHKSLTKMLSKAIKKHGYRWFLKHGQKAHKKAVKVLRAKVQIIHYFILSNAKVIVKKRHRGRLNKAKKRLYRKIKKLLRGFILLSTKLKRRVRTVVFKTKRHTQILRKPKIKVRPIVITKRDMELPALPRVKKCRVRELDLMGGLKTLLRARKCLLTKLRPSARGKNILNLNVRRKTLVAEIWKRRENLKFKALLKRLIRSAKSWHKHQTKKMQGFNKLYRQILRTANKAFKTLTRQISAGIKKHGFRWYLRLGQKKYRQAQSILRNKIQFIHQYVLGNLKALLRKRHRININAAKKRLGQRIRKLLRGYILLSTKLRRRVKISLSKKKRHSIKKAKPAPRKIPRARQIRARVHREVKFRPLVIARYAMELPPLPRVKKCRVRENDLLGSIKKLLKARKCLLTKFPRRQEGKKILKLNVRRATLVAEIWKQRENLKFKALLSRLIKSAKAWHKKQTKKLKGFIKMYKQIIRTAIKAYKSLTKQISASIKKHGFRWYTKHGQKKYKKAQAILRGKVTFIHQYVMGNAKALVKKRQRINLGVAKKRLNRKIKKLLRGFILLSTKLKRRVRVSVFTKKTRQVTKKPKRKFLKIQPFVRHRKTTFSQRTCNCEKKYINANKWVKQQLKKFQILSKKYKKRVTSWYKKNKKVGKWWLRRALDRINAAWIKWALFVEGRRIKYLKYGPKKFNIIFRNKIRSKLTTIVSKLRQKVKASIRLGIKSLHSKKLRVSASKFKSQAKRIRRLIVAKVWHRKQKAKFGGYLLLLQKISNKWFKKETPKAKWAIKLYRHAVNKVYEGYLRNLKVMQRAIKIRGPKWYKKFGCKKWRRLLQVMYNQARKLTKLILQKSSRIFALKNKIPASLVRQKLNQQIRVLIRTTGRLFKRLNRTLKVIVRRLLKKTLKAKKGQFKRVKKLRGRVVRVHKKRSLNILKQLPRLPKIKICLTDKSQKKKKTSSKLSKHKKLSKRKRTKIFRKKQKKQIGVKIKVKSSHKKTKRVSGKKQKKRISFKIRVKHSHKKQKRVALSKVNIRRRIVVGEIWRRRENARFNTFLQGLKKSAQSWYKLHGKKVKGWLKIHRQILRTARKSHKILTNLISKLIKKRGYKWYLKHGQKKYKISSKVLRQKTRLIQRIIIVKTKALLTKKGRVNLQSVKKQLTARVNKLLRGYILLSTKLKRRIKVLFKPKVVVTLKQKTTSTKLGGKTCNCRKKYISANRWVAQQIRKFAKLTRQYKQRILQWYAKNKKIGKWWLLKGLDALDEVWIEYVTFLEELRESAIALGPKRFHTLYKPIVKAKLSRSLSKIQRRIVAHIKKGRKVRRLMKKSTFKSKLARLRQCRPQFQITKKILLANVWRRNVKADFRAYLLTLHRITRKWYKKQPLKVRWAVKLYRPVLNKVYKNFLRVLNTVHRTMKRYGYKWYKKYGQKKFRQFIQKTSNTARRVVRVLMKKTRQILTSKTRVSVGAFKRKLKKQISLLIRQIVRTGRVTARQMKTFVKATVKKMKISYKLKLKLKTKVKVTQKQKKRRSVKRGYFLLSTSQKRKQKAKLSRVVSKRRKARKSRCMRTGGEVKLPGLVIRRGISGYFIGLNGLSFIVSEKPKKGNVVRFFGPLNVSGSLSGSSGCCVRTQENVILRGKHRGHFFKNGLDVVDQSSRKRKCHCYK